MHYRTSAIVTLAIILSSGIAFHSRAQEFVVMWDGGDGEWDDGNWNGGQTPVEVLGQNDGSNGSKSPNGGETITIGGGAAVNYDGDFLRSDFRVKQGSSLVIRDGASWTQAALPTWSENRWTEMDPSNLILDGGTFRRTGHGPSTDPSGGALIFGSWRGDDNFDNEKTPPPETINISITNGGRLENEGQLWFGGWEDHPAGLIVSMTINDGHVDLTGGDVEGVGDEADADWVFIFDIDEQGQRTENPGDPKDETYAVNFTGPGSITVDRSGIIAPLKEEFVGQFIWTNLDPISYENLWEMGILQANGRSGPDGAAFADFFTVTGVLGSDNYTLTSRVVSVPPLDCNGDGVVDAGDLLCACAAGVRDGLLAELNLVEGDLDGNGTVAFDDFLVLSANFGQQVANYTLGDIDCNGEVAFADFLALSANFGKTSGGGVMAAVPEPSAMFLLSLCGLCFLRTRRRRS